MVAVSTAAMASSFLLRPRASFRRALPPPPPSSRRALPAPRVQAASTQQEQPSLSTRSEGERGRPAGTRLYSLAPYPLLLAALLPGAEPVTAVFAPFVELVKSWDLPGWLVHWGHPGNMVRLRLYAPPVPCSQMTFLQFLRVWRGKIMWLPEQPCS